MRRSAIFRLAPLLVFAVVAATIQPALAGDSAPSNDGARAGPAVTRLKVMTFNVEYGGTVIDFSKIVEAVVASDADVVALNEIYRHGARLAAEAGYPYASPRLDVISRYPLLDPAGADGRYLFVQISPGRGRRDHQRAPELGAVLTAEDPGRLGSQEGAPERTRRQAPGDPPGFQDDARTGERGHPLVHRR